MVKELGELQQAFLVGNQSLPLKAMQVSKMQQVLDLVVSDIASIRTGRATPALVEDLHVAVYGGQQKLKIQELATISAPDIQTLVIEPWDKSIIGEIAEIVPSSLSFRKR